MTQNNKIEICLSKKTMLFLARLAYKSSQYIDYETYKEIIEEIKSGIFSED